MRDPAPNLAGKSEPDQRLWNTYLFWARSRFPTPFDHLDISDPSFRRSAEESDGLQAIVFAVFALEFRLRSVYAALGLQTRPRDGVNALLSAFKARVTGHLGFHGRPIGLPDEWDTVCARLKNLIGLRNKIAHANREPVTTLLATGVSLSKSGEDGYNAFIDAVRVINVAIGYDTKSEPELSAYYARLKVPVTGA